MKRSEKIKEEISKLDVQIKILQGEVDDLKEQVTTILIKIELKHKINRKRQAENFQTEYVPVQSDPIDVRMSEYANVNETRVPIKRIEEGRYMFGRKEISITPDKSKAGGYKVEIPSERLTISINELLTSYSEKEINELSKMREDQQIVVGDKSGENITAA